MLLSLIISLTAFFHFGENAEDRVDLLHDKVYQMMENHPDSALLLADQSLELAQSCGYTWGEGNAYYIKGYILNNIQNKPISGLLMYLKAAEILDLDPSPKAAKTYSSVILNAGAILRPHGKYKEAIDLYDQGILKAKSFNLVNQELKLIYNKSHVLKDAGQLNEAAGTINYTISLAALLGDKETLYKCWNMLGITLKENGSIDHAIKAFKKVIEAKDSDPVIKAHALNNLGNITSRFLDIEMAKEYHRSSARIADSIGHKKLQFVTAYNLGEIYFSQDSIDEAFLYVKQAESNYDKIELEYEYLDLYHLESLLYTAKGDLPHTRQYIDKYRQSIDQYQSKQTELIKIKNQFQVDLLLASFDSEIEHAQKLATYHQTIAYVGTIVLLITMLALTGYKIRLVNLGKEIREIVE